MIRPRLGQGLAPLGELMGMGWCMLVALIAGFVAKGKRHRHARQPLQPKGDGLIRSFAAQVAPAPALALITVTMRFIPGLATVAVMRQETGSWRRTLFGVTLLLVIALGTGTLVHQGSRFLGITG